MQTFFIIRFFKSGRKPRLILRDISEEEKDAWCNSNKTSKAGEWFDGFSSMENFANYGFTKNTIPKYSYFFNPELDKSKYL